MISKKKKEAVSSAETSKPVESEVVQDTSIVVPGEPKKEGIPENVAESQFMGIDALTQNLSEEKIAFAEISGIPIRGLLVWAKVIEANVINQGKALQQLGVNLQPVVELAQKVKASQGTGVQTPQKDAGDRKSTRLNSSHLA